MTTLYSVTQIYRGSIELCASRAFQVEVLQMTSSTSIWMYIDSEEADLSLRYIERCMLEFLATALLP
jgi:hypothetical protein